MLLYLLPPSEGKQLGGRAGSIQRSFDLALPTTLAHTASEKELKCTGKRYTEALHLNTHLLSTPVLPAIERYNGVMYTAFAYDTLSKQSKDYADQHIILVSGLYGLLRPQDMIANYKLPISTRLQHRWHAHGLTDMLANYALQHAATLIDLLPGAYKKMIDRRYLAEKSVATVTVDFYRKGPEGLEKYRHGVKQVKGQRLHTICQQQIAYTHQLGGVQLENEIQIII